MANQPWTKKYQPKSSKEIVGQNKAVENLKYYINNYKKQTKKGIILYGMPGNGKTSSIYALANELNREMIEINASDFRNKEQVESLIGNASQQRSLFMKEKIILFDEIDGLSGNKDRGGISAITKIIGKSKFPIILTANNPYDKKLSTLRKKSEMIEFKTLAYTSIYNCLKKICKQEKIEIDEITLKTLARIQGGDLRGAIIDLQLLSTNKKINTKTLEELSSRNQKQSMLKALIKILKNSDPKIAISALDDVDEDLSKSLLWIDENLPKEYKNPQDLNRAYNFLSKSEIFNSRIRKWQYWRLLVYFNILMTSGVAVSKDKKYDQFIVYRPTTRILKLWRAKMKNAKKKEISKKISKKMHTSSKKVLKDVLPFIKIGVQNNNKFTNELVKEFKLNDDEINYLMSP
tara:strand:- start:3704 stop:4918 length:1215 start_codon:yes stop_codon:yes gene_type:complete